MSLTVRHNMEVAHRLYEMAGKCEAIHGHSMWVDLELLTYQHTALNGVYTNSEGVPLEFGIVKAVFRKHLDKTYDHHLLLNVNDPFTSMLYKYEVVDDDGTQNAEVQRTALGTLPGLRQVEGDPTTENLARWIAEWAAQDFAVDTRVTVHETSVNAASYKASYAQEVRT